MKQNSSQPDLKDSPNKIRVRIQAAMESQSQDIQIPSESQEIQKNHSQNSSP